MWGKQNHCPIQSTKNKNQMQSLIYILIHIFLDSWLEISLLIFQIVLLLLVHKTMWHRVGKQGSCIVLYCNLSWITLFKQTLLSKNTNFSYPKQRDKNTFREGEFRITRGWNLTFEYNLLLPQRRWKPWKATYLQSHCQQSVSGTGLWRGRQVKELNLRQYFSSPNLL